MTAVSPTGGSGCRHLSSRIEQPHQVAHRSAVERSRSFNEGLFVIEISRQVVARNDGKGSLFADARSQQYMHDCPCQPEACQK